jgi:hypothetical protein
VCVWGGGGEGEERGGNRTHLLGPFKADSM